MHPLPGWTWLPLGASVIGGAALALGVAAGPASALAVAGAALGWLAGRRDSTDPAPAAPLPAAVTRSSRDALPAVGGGIDAESARENARHLSVLSAVVDGMAEGVWVTGRDGRVVEHNVALKELLFSGQALVGQRPGELFRSEALDAAVRRACEEGASTGLELSIEGVRPRVVTVHVAPLGHDLGGSSAVAIDVTELRRLEKVRKDFVANVSHELRTPITAIRGYAETLQGGALADAAVAARMVDIIHRQSLRLSELVEDLLELSRLESKEFRLAAEPVDLAEATQRALEAVRPKALPRNTAFDVHVAPGLAVLADRRGVEQLLINLVDNAVKYTPANGRVQVVAQPTAPGLVEVCIKDNGPGIEARHLTRIFERFYRVDKGRSREMGGTGLGLSIVKHLATEMKGDVRCESAPGVGSTFAVTLPAAPHPVEQAPPTAGPPSA